MKYMKFAYMGRGVSDAYRGKALLFAVDATEYSGVEAYAPGFRTPSSNPAGSRGSESEPPASSNGSRYPGGCRALIAAVEQGR